MGNKGLRAVGGNPAASPYAHGPYTWDQHVTFSQGLTGVNRGGNVFYVDGTNGSDGANGKSWKTARKTIQAAVDLCGSNDTVFIAAHEITAGDTDPGSYAETIIIPVEDSGLALIGVGTGRVQGGLPQIKPGTGTAGDAILTIRAPGCLIANLGFNGVKSADSTQLLVGILLDDNNSTKTAFGTTIMGCHFKNCAGTTVTNGATGGAITWSSSGNAWQVLISGNRFYKNVCDVCLIGTSVSVPQDVVIEDNIFSGPASVSDCNLFLKGGGSGMNGVIIRNNVFTAMPALSAGSIKRFMDLTGCVGILASNMFACTTDPALTELQFAAAGTAAYVPATVFMAGNAGEVQSTGNTSNQAAIGRYA